MAGRRGRKSKSRGKSSFKGKTLRPSRKKGKRTQKFMRGGFVA